MHHTTLDDLIVAIAEDMTEWELIKCIITLEIQQFLHRIKKSIIDFSSKIYYNIYRK